LIRLPFVCDDSGVDEADDIADADDAALGQCGWRAEKLIELMAPVDN